MLNKTILVFYINIKHLSHFETEEIIEKVRQSIRPKKEDEDKLIQYIIPVTDQETRVECINAPTYISSESEKEVIISKIKEIDDKLDRITSQINAEFESRKVITEKNV